MSQDATEHGLDAVEIFHDLTADERARLTAELDTLSLKRGETLVRQGEPPTRSISSSPGASS